MPYELDDIDIGIINALQEDGRKSFRQISREINISTPTIQARYQRLVHIGLIKSIAPIIDTSKLGKSSKIKIQPQPFQPSQETEIKTGMSVKMICDFCDGSIGEKPRVFRFANFERLFCCNTCKSQFKEKYKGKIESMVQKAKEKN